ncbi:hypothetical protein LZ32DRAFT_147897 [Colletotrichum eremochloae]|nr:hypothetical protein LZ32DRAFT_147897 [Colletotrichum eremochloae]
MGVNRRRSDPVARAAGIPGISPVAPSRQQRRPRPAEFHSKDVCITPADVTTRDRPNSSHLPASLVRGKRGVDGDAVLIFSLDKSTCELHQMVIFPIIQLLVMMLFFVILLLSGLPASGKRQHDGCAVYHNCRGSDPGHPSRRHRRLQTGS